MWEIATHEHHKQQPLTMRTTGRPQCTRMAACLQHRQAQPRRVFVMDQVDGVASPARHLALAQEEGVGAPAAGRAEVGCAWAPAAAAGRVWVRGLCRVLPRAARCDAYGTSSSASKQLCFSPLHPVLGTRFWALEHPVAG